MLRPRTTSRYRRRTLRQWVAIGSSVAIVLSLAAIVAGAFGLIQLTDARERLADNLDPAVTAAQQLTIAYIDQETGVRGYALGRRGAVPRAVRAGRRRAGSGGRRDQPSDRRALSGGAAHRRRGPGRGRGVAHRVRPARHRRRRAPGSRAARPGGGHGPLRRRCGRSSAGSTAAGDLRADVRRQLDQAARGWSGSRSGSAVWLVAGVDRAHAEPAPGCAAAGQRAGRAGPAGGGRRLPATGTGDRGGRVHRAQRRCGLRCASASWPS